MQIKWNRLGFEWQDSANFPTYSSWESGFIKDKVMRNQVDDVNN